MVLTFKQRKQQFSKTSDSNWQLGSFLSLGLRQTIVKSKPSNFVLELNQNQVLIVWIDFFFCVYKQGI